MLRFIDRDATFTVPQNFADKTVHTLTNPRGQRVTVSIPAEATPATCVDARIERQRRTLGAGLTLLNRGVLKTNAGQLQSAEINADLMGQKVWSQLLAGASSEGPWLLQAFSPQPDPALVQAVLTTLVDTEKYTAVPGTREHSARWFCGPICFELPGNDFSTEWSTWLEGSAGTLKLFLGLPPPPPEEMFYSDPPLEQLELRESRIDSTLGRVPLTIRAVKVHGSSGPSEKVHLSAELALPESPRLSIVGAGDRAQHGALDRAFRSLLTSLKVAKRRG